VTSRIDKRLVAALAATSGAVMVLLAVMAMSAPRAHAEEVFGYCGGANLEKHSVCTGSDRNFYKLWGYGESKSVCLYADNYFNYTKELWRGFACSTGANEVVGVTLTEQVYAHPAIEDNAAGATRVQAYTYTH
jgi:hypothetical protein